MQFSFLSHFEPTKKYVEKYFFVEGNSHGTLTPAALLAGGPEGLAAAELASLAAARAFCCLPACKASSCSLRISSKSLTFFSHSDTTFAQLPTQLLLPEPPPLPPLACRCKPDRRGRLS